ncbi:hypothetical protein GGS21DRAFT_73263 [Xylaria nigripes]|nr:hypothetical protein GGS21DRAFT_73263 [Xylaria nigripes]
MEQQRGHGVEFAGDVGDAREEGGTPRADPGQSTIVKDPTTRDVEKESDDGKSSRDLLKRSALARQKMLDTKAYIVDWLFGRSASSASKNSSTAEPAGDPQHGIDEDCLEIRDVQDMCPACSTPYCQAAESLPFKSSLKLLYNDPASQKWQIGNELIFHESIDDNPCDETIPLIQGTRTLKLIAPDVPTHKVYAAWKADGKILTISPIIQGERLYDIWWDLTPSSREAIAKQVSEHVSEWRRTDLGGISSLDGAAVQNHANLFGASYFGPFSSDQEFWNAISRRMDADGETMETLRSHMPPSSPCVFTHGDLSTLNIYVHDGAVVAITGFENAAALPVWAEDVALHFCYCEEDEAWKPLLGRYLPGYRAARDWWALWTAGEDQARLDGLKTACVRWDATEITDVPFWEVPLDEEVTERMSFLRNKGGDDGEEGDASSGGHESAPERGRPVRSKVFLNWEMAVTSVADEPEDGKNTVLRPDSPDRLPSFESKRKGLRPLSLPVFVLSKSRPCAVDAEGETGLATIREDGAGEGSRRRDKRVSVFGDRASPGGLYSALRAVSTEGKRRHVRSGSEDLSKLRHEEAGGSGIPMASSLQQRGHSLGRGGVGRREDE